MRSLLYVPTDRECEHAVVAYTAEAEQLAEITGDAAFVLIESNESPHVRQHARVIAELRPKRRIPLIHFDLPSQRHFMQCTVDQAQLAGPEKEWLLNLLLPLGINYSAAPNKAALLACALNFDTLHRRDSDTLPQMYVGKPLYPSVIEGKMVGQTLGTTGLQSEHYPPTAPVMCVATNYQGDDALDRSQFLGLNTELLVEQERLDHPYESRSALEERISRKRSTPLPYSEDVIEMDTKGKGEMGACALADVFRYLPEMPLGDTLGTDYFQRNLLYRMKLPIVYHNRRVLHAHLGIRDLTTHNDFLRYSIRDARFKLLKNIWRKHNKLLDTMYSTPPNFPVQKTFSAEAYARSLEHATEKVTPKEQQTFINSLSSFYQNAGRASGQSFKYDEVAEYLRTHAVALIQSVASGFIEYAHLTRLWAVLVVCSNGLLRDDGSIVPNDR